MVEIVYALYRFGDDRKKAAYASLLRRHDEEYVLTAKRQFHTADDMVGWARARLADPAFRNGREFLYFYPLALAGDDSDLERIAQFAGVQDKLVRDQVCECLAFMRSREVVERW